MQILRVTTAYFSPGNTTMKVVTKIAQSFADYPTEAINLARPFMRENKHLFKENDLLIIGVPAYGGRMPAPVAEALKNFRGMNTPVVLVATYGNRAVDDTLMELRMELVDRGFVPVAAATFSCQHTLLSELALGRPDEDDLAVAKKLGDELRTRLQSAVLCGMKVLEIPGHYPYEKPQMGILPFEVETNEYCIYCMLCADACPVEAISHDNPYQIEHDKCIRCTSCIRICPAQAKSFSKEGFEALQEKIRPYGETRQEPWYVIG